eukprot:PRCOL_00004337-RA
MAPKIATKRLQKELKSLALDAPPGIAARPSETDILEWHYILDGPSETPYAGGVYHGKLVFPPEYPNRPPAISMLTPSGRFKTGTSLCFSMSEYHPESWQPSWKVETILLGLQSFMCEEAVTQGSIASSEAERKDLARKAATHCLQSASFKRHFPDMLDTMREREAAWEDGGLEAARAVQIGMPAPEGQEPARAQDQRQQAQEKGQAQPDAQQQAEPEPGPRPGAQQSIEQGEEAQATSAHEESGADGGVDPSWSVKKLRKYIEKKGGSVKGCREKADLLARALECASLE